MAAFFRVRAPNIQVLVLAHFNVALADGQAFYETPKAYEIWQEKPSLRFIKRIDKRRVLIVRQSEPDSHRLT